MSWAAGLRLRRLRTPSEVALAAVVAAVVVLPLAMLLKEPLADIGEQWDKVGRIPELGRTIRTTLLLAAGSVAIAVTAGTMLAWCASQVGGRLASLALAIAVLPMLTPAIATTIAWIFLFSPDVGYGNQLLRALPLVPDGSGPLNVYSVPFIVLLTALNLVPFVFLFVSTALRGVDPALEHAARVFGAGWMRAQWRVVLPLIRPALVYSAVIVLLFGLGQFVTPLVLGRTQRIDVLTTEMYRVVSLSFDHDLAAFLGLPLLVIGVGLVVLQRRMVGVASRYAVTTKGAAAPASTRRWPGIVVLVYAALVAIPPLVALTIAGFSRYWSSDLSLDLFWLENFRELWRNDIARQAVTNSVQLALMGTVIALVVVTAIAFVLVRRRGLRCRLLDIVVNLPLSIPGVVFGLGVFLAFAIGPVRLYGTRQLFLLIYFIVVLPHGVRLLMGGVYQLPVGVEAAARVAGAGPVRTFLRVTLPLLRRSVVTAGVLMFVMMSHEFGGSAMVRSPGNEVMATQLYSYWEQGRYADVAAMGLVIIAVSLLGLVGFLLAGGRRLFQRM